MKAPSDHEDGGVDDGDAAGATTAKFPSDLEDGGFTPSPDFIGGTPDAPPPSAAVQRISDDVLGVWRQGPAALEARVAELVDIGTRARFSPEGLREHTAELAGLRTALTGPEGVAARIAEIEHTMMVALMTPEASQAMQLELDVLRALLAGMQS